MNTNIVEIKVKNQSIIRSRPLYQWDSGQILKVIDQEIPDNTEVQFGSACLQPSVPAFMVGNQVNIPQAVMDQAMEITAYMVIVEPDSETTVKEIRIPIKPKPKPSDYVPDEEEPSIMQVIQRKADKGGWTPNKYLGTDAEGNMVEKDAPSGGDSGATAEQLEQIEINKQNIESLYKDFSGKADKATTLDGYGITDGATKSDVSQLSGKIANQQAQIDAKQPKGNYLTTETDPTVPAWAKADNKPTYTADEVGARPDTWTPSASEVGADPAGTAAGAVSSHNTAEDAHEDIRLLVAGLTTRLNALADSDDETLDQVSELVAYIKANRELIESVTTGKVSVSDIVDNLTTNVSNKPLSAAQGVALKALIDAITVPTKVSQLENDSGYITQHQDLSEYAKSVSLLDSASQTSANLTPAEVLQAVAAGKILTAIGGVCTLMSNSGTSQVVVHRQYNDSNIVAKVTINSDKSYAIELITLAKNDDLTAHTGNSTVHITADERKKWNAKSDFSGNYDDLKGAPSSMKNPFALKINGTSYDGSKEVNLVIEGGGASGESELLGETPLTLSKDISTINLVGSGDVSYAIQSPTVADLENTTNITYSNCKLVQQDGYVELQSTGGSGWYSNYADIVLSGLTIGERYVIYVDGLGRTDDVNNHRYCGYYAVYSGESYNSGNEIGTLGASFAGYISNIETLKLEFTATTESVTVRMYPSKNSYFSSGASVAEINSIYINRAGSNVHTSILNVSGTFTDSKMLYSIPSGTTISSTPSCSVYGIITESGDSSKPMYGKTIVCFGDSLFGMYRGDTSAPAYIQEITGATVYNVGFGGCRMSVHPSSGYAEFCMWALAKAIAENDWTSQDSAASSGSDYFPDQLALLESIDFSGVDAVVIHYGTNDFGGSVAIGSSSDSSDYSTLCGALRYSIEKLLTAYPKLRIYISLPVFRYWTGSDGTVTYSDTYQNSQSNTLVEVVNAIADVAKEYNLPVIDCYHGLGINKANASTFLLDGTHHNEVGRKRFGNFIGSQIVANR